MNVLLSHRLSRLTSRTRRGFGRSEIITFWEVTLKELSSVSLWRKVTNGFRGSESRGNSVKRLGGAPWLSQDFAVVKGWCESPQEGSIDFYPRLRATVWLHSNANLRTHPAPLLSQSTVRQSSLKTQVKFSFQCEQAICGLYKTLKECSYHLQNYEDC